MRDSRPPLPRLAIELGGVMIKLGQFISSRVDILPKEIIDELASLQDEVPPESFERHSRRRSKANWGNRSTAIFTSIEPLAHRGRVAGTGASRDVEKRRARDREDAAPRHRSDRCGRSGRRFARRLAGSSTTAPFAAASIWMRCLTSSAARCIRNWITWQKAATPSASPRTLPDWKEIRIPQDALGAHRRAAR